MTLEETLATIAVYREAVATKDWTTARRVWELLAPWHEMLIARSPEMVHVAEVLRRNEAMTKMAERLSNAVH